MTAHAYAEGFTRGCDWAERDLLDGSAAVSEADAIRDAALSLLRNVPRSAAGRRYIAEELGQARGYRLTLARYERGELTREMFEVSR